MKKIVLSIFSLAVIAGANAQSGTVLVGGNVDFNSRSFKDSSGNKDNMNYFQFSPTIGYQFNDNWTVGVVGSVSTTKNSSIAESDDVIGISGIQYDDKVKTTAWGVGPFVRYTAPLSDIFSVYGQLQGQYQSSQVKYDGKNLDSEKRNGFNVGFFPAVFINVKNGFGLNFNIGGIEYTSMKYKQSQDKVNNFNITFGRSVGIGISKNF
ncbi:hypothetical protein A8C56_00970 [Niabella ginsenosidivorans]|uniref:Outer membrane protein beta-barrel domain-containing protein n=1 Tax=Niabella ginsenosidivorans TaxID=1176587 RepID=A0A1A9I7G6_9BACT|nr:outer membrane beta-barrel protein [Niabella ginsenosidivorans]ANH83618.1 hypothetical protein A8C56_00970 [Niabella ginsenosidivorans]